MKTVVFMGLDMTEIATAEYVPGQGDVSGCASIKGVSELWSMNDWFRTAPMVNPDRCWNMHREVGVHRKDKKRCFHPQRYNEWARSTDVYTLRPEPAIRRNVVQDLSQVVDLRRDILFSSSWGYLFWTAWVERFERIVTLGVTYRHQDEYRGQLLGFMSGVWESRQKGITVDCGGHEERWLELLRSEPCGVSYAALEAEQGNEIRRIRR